MAKKLYLVFSGFVFLLVAIFHLARLICHWPVVVGTTTIPYALSDVGLPASAAYCIWAIWLLRRERRGRWDREPRNAT
jgi:hypothetical protein